MNRKNIIGSVFAVVGIAGILGSIALTQPSKDKKAPTAPAAGQPEMKLPPGWTAEDMQACMAAGMPGKMHEYLSKSIGTWQGKETMWMAPGTEPIKTECVAVITGMMDGRYTKIEVSGDMPDMGPFMGMGINGYDNVSQKFVSTWIDNMGTGMMTGSGDLSADGKTLTLNYTMNCPITKKPVAMREIQKHTGPNAMTLEMYGTDPKSGKEFKSLVIEFTKK